MAEVLFFV